MFRKERRKGGISSEKEFKSPKAMEFEIKKYNSMNDESIIINDDDDEDEGEQILVEKKQSTTNSKVPVTRQTSEIIVESTLLDVSVDLNATTSKPSTQTEEPAKPSEDNVIKMAWIF